MNKILVIGDNCVDLKIREDVLFKKDKNYIPEDYYISLGGTGVNFAVAFSKLGGTAYYFTPISSDPFGHLFFNYLKENGVHFIRSISNNKTALILSFLNRVGERTTFALIKDVSYTDISFDKFRKLSIKFNYIYISGGILTNLKAQKEVKNIVTYSKNIGKKLFFDLQFRIGKGIKGFRQAVLEISKLSDIIFGNEDEFKAFGDSEINSMVRNGAIIVVKRGKNGACAYSLENTYETGPFKVSPKDTTGAGDIFNAAFLTMFLKGTGIKDSLDFANKVAALSTEKLGIDKYSFDRMKGVVI